MLYRLVHSTIFLFPDDPSANAIGLRQRVRLQCLFLVVVALLSVGLTCYRRWFTGSRRPVYRLAGEQRTPAGRLPQPRRVGPGPPDTLPVQL